MKEWTAFGLFILFIIVSILLQYESHLKAKEIKEYELEKIMLENKILITKLKRLEQKREIKR